MKREAVLFVAVPEAIRQEGLMAEFIGPDRKPHVAPFYPKPGDMVYGLTPRFRQMLYMRGIATPIRFPDEVKPRNHLHTSDLRNNGVRGIGRTVAISKKPKKSQKTLLDFLGTR